MKISEMISNLLLLTASESDYQKIKVLEDQLNHAGNLIRIKTEAENLETLNFCDKDLVEQSAAAREQNLN